MATHAGKEGTVKIGANEIAEIRDWSITETGETVDDTKMGDATRTHIATVNSWEASVSSWWDETDTNGQGAMTAGASLRDGRDSPLIWRRRKETPKKKNRPITSKKEIGLVPTPVSGRMPDT